MEKNLKKLEKLMRLETKRTEKYLGECSTCKNNTLFFVMDETPSGILLGISFWTECRTCGYKGPTGFAD